MKLELIDIDELSKSLPSVKNQKSVENGQYSREGLFSQQIFGPIKSYKCACGNKSGRKYNGITCTDCSVKVESAVVRRRNYAKIELPIKILNPLFYFLILEIKPSAQLIINNMLDYKKSYIFKNNEISILKEGDEEGELLKGLSGVIKYIKYLVENRKDPFGEFIKNNIEKAEIQNILVIPPAFRPCSRDPNGSYISDEINRLYTTIITRVNHINQIPIQVSEDNTIYEVNFKHLQKLCLDLYKYIFEKLSKKKGLIRANILGKRVDFSGRAVISPEPSLKLDECGIPYTMILEMFKPELTTYLINKRLGKRYNQIVRLIDECIKNDDYQLYPYVEKFCEDKICILNRQPTLHRLSILGFKIKPNKGNTIQIHPLVCPPFNADFDGDSCTADITIRIKDKLVNTSIGGLQGMKEFVLSRSKTKENGVVINKYRPVEKMSILAINPENGVVEEKNISEYSVHRNIEMYLIHDPNSRFKDFHSSYDHSLIIYDESDQEIKKVSPRELLDNPEGKYFIQKGV